MDKHAKTVFVSSTCYDLIDLRAELELELRDLELTPLMSDSHTSDFNVLPNANSIESCLVNIRRCDIVLFVLSQRYGPSLKHAGYEDVSATHLEYREARKAGRSIYFYVRDRLEADFNIWKRNKRTDIKLSWVQENDFGLFKLIEEHRSLSATSIGTNWLWTFHDSSDLRRRIRKDLRLVSDTAILKSILRSGKSPFLLARIKGHSVDKVQKRIELNLLITIETCIIG